MHETDCNFLCDFPIVGILAGVLKALARADVQLAIVDSMMGISASISEMI